MSDFVDLLHDYVNQYDRMAEDMERLQSTFDRLRVDFLGSQTVNRDLIREVAALKALPSYRSKHDYVLLTSVLTKAQLALKSVRLAGQSEETIRLTVEAIAAMEKL